MAETEERLTAQTSDIIANCSNGAKIFARRRLTHLTRYGSISGVLTFVRKGTSACMQFVYYLILFLILGNSLSLAQARDPKELHTSLAITEISDLGHSAPDFALQVTHHPLPKYSNEALEKAVSGQVILQAIFGEDGKVTDIQVLKGLPDGLTERARESLQKTRFEPARKNGKPIPMRAKIVYSFHCPGLTPKRIKAVLQKEQPWLSNDSLVWLANRLSLVNDVSYYDVIRFAPELIKDGVNWLSAEERKEYLELVAQMEALLTPTQQEILQRVPLLSGKEVAVHDRQQSNAIVKKGWGILPSSAQQRWRELHNRIVELGLFRRRSSAS